MTNDELPTTDQVNTARLVGRRPSVVGRKLLRLLRRCPLQLMTAIMLALAAGAIAATSAAGLALVEPHSRPYAVSLLSILEADYTRWPDSGSPQRRLDAAIIAEAARDEIARNVTPGPGQAALVPLELPPLPQAAAADGSRPSGAQAQATRTTETAGGGTARPSQSDTTVASAPTAAAATNGATQPPAATSASSTSAATTAPAATAVPVATAPAITAAPPEATDPPVLPANPPVEIPAPSPVVPTDPPLVPSAPPIFVPAPLPSMVPPSATSAPAPTARPNTPRPKPPKPTAVPPTRVPTLPPSAVPTILPTATPVPVPTPIPTNTPVPAPTNTPVPAPTNTPVPPTNTSVPPTNTSVPPTNTSVPPTNTSVPPTNTSVPPTNTSVPPALVVQIVAPSNGATISGVGQTRFQAIAYDPSISTTDGAGITNVSFSIVQLTGGTYSFSAVEAQAAYCVFSGNGPCSTNPAFASMTPGTYQLTATASAPSKPSVSVSVTFTIP